MVNYEDGNPERIASQMALRIFQEALLTLSAWSGEKVSHSLTEIDDTAQQVIQQAKELAGWSFYPTPDDAAKHIDALRVVFDAVHLDKDQEKIHYWPAWAISNENGVQNGKDGSQSKAKPARKHSPPIPYPTTQKPTAEELEKLKNEVKQTLEGVTADNWQKLPLLMFLLEKYGTYISFGQPDVALFDQAKTTAAIAVALGNNPAAKNLCLVAGDLSGIQDFIYTISSDGALKSLRARSFTLELVTEEIVQQLLSRLGLPRSSVIYAGGGNLYLLAPDNEDVHQKVAKICDDFNRWLFNAFQQKVFLSLTSLPFSTDDVQKTEFGEEHWETAIKELGRQKNRKFNNQLSQLLKIRHAHEPCKVCHRDDVKVLEQLGGDGAEACPTCNEMFYLGQKLFKVGKLVRSANKDLKGTLRYTDHPQDKGYIEIRVGETPIYYHLFESQAKIIAQDAQAVYFINNWDADTYNFSHLNNPTPLLLGNYAQKSKENEGDRETFITAQEMANEAKGISRVGHLRMDVDKLGQIFAKGLKNNYTLARLSGLSRQMSYFFKVYLNSLAEFRERDFLAHQAHQTEPHQFQALTSNPRQDLLFIYAGGDDLFVSGAWDQIVEFAFDVYQSFRSFTGWHPDITLSGGISLHEPKYPLYQSADNSKKAEDAAKGNGRDSLSLFEQVFKWAEWLGTANTSVLTQEVQEYLEAESRPEWFGIFPFVNYLQKLLGTQYSKSFTRNLLSTAQLQEQWIKQLKREKKIAEKAKLSTKHLSFEKDLQYFLHLPRVAYTLARFPVAVKNAEGFDLVRKSLKSPYNAPYFRAIATWLELLNRSTSETKENDE